MIINTDNSNCVIGGTSIIVIEKENGRVFKLFKSFYHPDNRDNYSFAEAQDYNVNNYKVFETQFEAFKLVQSSKILKKHTPEFFGAVEIQKVIIENHDLTQYFLPHCCLSMQYIIGGCEKYILFKDLCVEMNMRKNLERIEAEFNSVGVGYLEDSSIIVTDLEIKFIDFATIDPFEFEQK